MVDFFVVILEHNLLGIQFFFNLAIFNWRIIALPCCVGFCPVSTWISHRYTYVHSLLNLPPTPSNSSRLSQSTGLSSLHQTARSHWLSILHTVIHMFQGSLSIHPTLPFPYCVHKSVLRVWVTQGYCSRYINYDFLLLIVYYLLTAPVENLAKKRRVLRTIRLFPPGQCSSHFTQNHLE